MCAYRRLRIGIIIAIPSAAPIAGFPIFVLSGDACFGAQPSDGGNGDGHAGGREGDNAARKLAERGGDGERGYRPKHDTTLTFGPFKLSDPCMPHDERGGDALWRHAASAAAMPDGYISAIDSGDPNHPQIVNGPGPFANLYVYFCCERTPCVFGRSFVCIRAGDRYVSNPAIAIAVGNPVSRYAEHYVASDDDHTSKADPLTRAERWVRNADSLPAHGNRATSPTPLPSPTPTHLAGVYRIGLLDSTTGNVTFFVPAHQNITGIALVPTAGHITLGTTPVSVSSAPALTE